MHCLPPPSFPRGDRTLCSGLYLLGLMAAVGTGLLLKVTVLRGAPSPFVMELPPYHLPTLGGLRRRTWHRLRDFLLEAGQVIVIMVAALAFLNSWGTDGSFGNDNRDTSVLSQVGRALTPAFGPMGIEQDNWPATVGIFTGILAKEAVVGTLNTLYSGDANEAGGAVSIGASFSEAASTIGAEPARCIRHGLRSARVEHRRGRGCRTGRRCAGRHIVDL